MPKTFALLDSNMYVRFVTQGEAGCSPEEWTGLQEAAKKGLVILLLPEVVLLEVRRLCEGVKAQITVECDRVSSKARKEASKHDKKEDVWSGIRDLPDDLSAFFEKWKQGRISAALARADEMLRILDSDQVTLIPFTPEIQFNSTRRMISAGIPRNNDADCFIIDSAAAFFKDSVEENQLLLCSNDRKAFAVESEGRYYLKPSIGIGLPRTELFTDLSKLLDFLRSSRSVNVPTGPAIEQALSQEALKDLREVLQLQTETWNQRAGWTAIVEQLVLGAAVWLEPVKNDLDKLGFAEPNGKPLRTQVVKGQGCILWEQWTYPQFVLNDNNQNFLWRGGVGTVTQFMRTDGANLMLVCGIRMSLRNDGVLLLTAANVASNGDCTHHEIIWNVTRQLSVESDDVRSGFYDLFSELISQIPSAIKRFVEMATLSEKK